jgi:hypothetical protein
LLGAFAQFNRNTNETISAKKWLFHDPLISLAWQGLAFIFSKKYTPKGVVTLKSAYG